MSDLELNVQNDKLHAGKKVSNFISLLGFRQNFIFIRAKAIDKWEELIENCYF